MGCIQLKDTAKVKPVVLSDDPEKTKEKALNDEAALQMKMEMMAYSFNQFAIKHKKE
jgi:hypothetical protein